MEVLHDCCGGLAVHAKTVGACLSKKGRKELRTFSTMTDELLQLADWLSSAGCTHVAIESRGVYGKPVFNLLEGVVTVILVNARHLKAVPGRKTDVWDCEWLADLLGHGLLKASFIPPVEIRELRELTRYRQTRVTEHPAVANRLQKLLEGANIKLAPEKTGSGLVVTHGEERGRLRQEDSTAKERPDPIPAIPENRPARIEDTDVHLHIAAEEAWMSIIAIFHPQTTDSFTNLPEVELASAESLTFNDANVFIQNIHAARCRPSAFSISASPARERTSAIAA